jgi:glycosyltransferase involved in cell wall biosynthesis
MKILIISKQSKRDGVTNHIKTISQELLKRNHSVSILSGPGEGFQDLKNDLIYPEFMNFTSKNPFNILINLIKLRKKIKRENFDIIHSHWRATSIYVMIASIFLKKRSKLIWSNHLIPIPSNLIMRKLTFYGERVIVESTDAKEFVHEKLKIPYEKIKIINHGIDIEKYKRLSKRKVKEFKDSLKIKNEKIILLFGRLSSEKGHLFLIKALAKLTSGWKVVFPGDTESNYKKIIISELKKKNLIDKVIFIKHEKPSKLLSIADVMVLPSSKEGFGIVNLESFAMKVPVIRTKTGGYLDMKEYVIGIEYGDIKQLQKSLQTFINDPTVYSVMVQKAFGSIRKLFSIDVMIDKIEQVYQESVSNK